jgi:hypothetical protein
MIKIVRNPAPVGNTLKGPTIFIFANLFTEKEVIHFFTKKNLLFYFQLATAGIESAVYKKLIAPFKNDMPVSNVAGFRSVCAEHKYAYFSSNFLNTKFSLSLPCQLVPLPEPNYKGIWAFIIPKNSPYKGLINWR